MSWYKKYLHNLAVCLSQTLNTILGGDPDESTSSRIGKLKQACGGEIPWRYPAAKAMDWILNRIDRGHSVGAIEVDEGKDAVHFGEKKKKKL